MDETPKRPIFHVQANLLAGLLAITPLIAVWLVFDFLLNILSKAGHPLAVALTDYAEKRLPSAAPVLANEGVRSAIAVIVALLILYVIGAIASRVLGQRIFHLFERIITRIPLVETIYSAVKKLVEVLQQKPGQDQRVVLIDFPHPGLKTLGFVMRVFRDFKTNEELAAVYVPSALNPTSGFLEILPVANLVFADIPTDQAMTMVISGGAVVPERMSILQTGA